MDFVEMFNVLLNLSFYIASFSVCSAFFVSSCYSILECYNLFSGVKQSIRSSFVTTITLNFGLVLNSSVNSPVMKVFLHADSSKRQHRTDCCLKCL